MKTMNQKKTENMMELAEALVRDRIQGARKGLPDEPKYLHSFRVRDLVSQCHPGNAEVEDLLIGALLHDVVEDGGVSFQELKDLGFTDRTIDLVRLCTHPMDITDSYKRWLLMIARLVEAEDEDAWRIKLADLTDNLSQSKCLSPEKRRFMVEVKAQLLIRLAPVSHSAHPLLIIEMEKQRAEMFLHHSA
jgi:(p)ppGpp synthase/HD superfamily hydrolase